MLPLEGASDILYTLLYGLSMFGNLLFLFYLIINKLRTSVDRLIFIMTATQLLLVILSIPFVYNSWLGQPYQYGTFGCTVLVPIHGMLDYTEAFVYTWMCVFVTEKLRGDRYTRWRVLKFIICIYIASLVIVLPLFGVMKLATAQTANFLQDAKLFNLTSDSLRGDGETRYCVEDWNLKAEQILKVAKVLLQFVLPFCFLVYYHRLGYRTVQYILQSLNSKKEGNVAAHYQSFSKVVADSQQQYQQNDPLNSSYLRFTESEDMNLEMNHLYQKHNSISSIQRDEGTANISVQIFTNEVTLDKITSGTPLWRDTRWQKENEFQKIVVSIKWFRYTRNIHQVFLGTALLFCLCVLPLQIFVLYTVSPQNNPLYFSKTKRLVCSVVFCLRLVPAMLNPWCFMVGVFKYRKSLFGRCYPQPPNFNVLDTSSNV